MSKITEFFNWLLASLDNVNKGASGKKVTALLITIAYCYSHRYVDVSNIGTVLTVDGGLISVLFGIGSYDKKLKTNENNQDKSNGN